jgi:hypothetical protein
MTSWIQANKSKMATYRSGYYQVVPEGVFTSKNMKATVVSAFYEMPSKYPLNTYKEWMGYFLRNINCHLVFFCEESMREFVEEAREEYMDRTEIVILPREQWTMNKKYPETFWRKQFTMDPEKELHKSTDLYKVWHEKKEFVKRAIALNPFEHDDFIWMDAGCIRSEDMASLVTNFPHASRIPTNRMLLLNVQPFSKQDNTIYRFEKGVSIQGGVTGVARIGGGVYAGSTRMWNQFDKAYNTIFEKYVTANVFLGKDQSLLATLVLENNKLVSLVEPKPFFADPWFNLVLYLGVNKKLFESFNDKSKNTVKKTYEELLRLQ